MTDEELMHIGIIRKSGRYPWGSGNSPYQRSMDFKAHLDDLRKGGPGRPGMTDSQIAKYIEDYANSGDGPKVSFKTTDLRAAISSSTEQIRAANVSMATNLRNKGMSASAIAERMLGDKRKESTVRGWLEQSERVKEDSLQAISDILKREVEGKTYLDVGKGTELYLGIASTKLNTAVARLRDEGYVLHAVKVPQLGTEKLTEYKILTKAGVTWKEAYDAANGGIVPYLTEHSDDGGLTFRKPKSEPVSVSSKKVEVRYKEDGGDTMDGVIQLRRGVPGLDLGESRYAQVRVAVDGTHYLKGMAMYTDDLPDGVDIRFNTNKSSTDPKIVASGKLGAMKPMKTDTDGNVDADNPFGASTYPRMYTDKSGKEKQSALNIVGTLGRGNVEGRWDDWSKSLSSQMLSKQPVKLAATQLAKTQAKKQKDLDEIMALTNPVVKKKLLEEFADSADSAAVHLKAASLDRQSTHVLLPMNSMRPNEIYARNFKDGEKVVLVRYPHGGPFEIPELTVNNKNLTARKILGAAEDAVGIHHSVAAQLSGADFDGDTVLVIPNDGRQVKTRPPLKGLENFDPKEAYGIPEGDTTIKRMTKANTQTEMGKISNLITDMTIKGADDDELANAVRHSMVVIDAEKHSLNYKQSEQDHGIKHLKERYQEGTSKGNEGASTIISRASSDKRIPHVKQPSGNAGIDSKTGAKILEPTGQTYTTKSGEVKLKLTRGTKMEFADDARKLMSKDPAPMEELYASHANTMKDLANQARLATLPLRGPKQSAAAKALYHEEVASLDNKLKTAQRNAPLERRAQSVGNAMAKARIQNNPQFDKDDVKKVKYQSLEEARNVTGANKVKVVITDREWSAIQDGAVSSTRLRELLAHADMDRVKELATPRARTSLTPGQIARAKSMRASNKSLTEIAEALGLPRSTVSDNLKS